MSAREIPFSNGTEVEWFTSVVCAQCMHDSPTGGGCDALVLGDEDVVEPNGVLFGGWPSLLIETDRTPANPLGVVCDDFEPADT
jgi:hypothetical protein